MNNHPHKKCNAFCPERVCARGRDCSQRPQALSSHLWLRGSQWQWQQVQLHYQLGSFQTRGASSNAKHKQACSLLVLG